MKKIKNEVEFPFSEQDLLNVVQKFAAGVGVVKKYTVKVTPDSDRSAHSDHYWELLA